MDFSTLFVTNFRTFRAEMVGPGDFQMLLRFRVCNFRSLLEEQELSLAASTLDDLPEAVAPSEFTEHGVLKVAAIYGANASGKTNVLRALHFMRTAVQESQRTWKPDQRIPRQAFRLASGTADRETLCEVDFEIENVRFTYGFAVDYKRVLREWLYAYPEARKQVWFERDGDAFTFGKKLPGENHRLIESVTRPNSLFLSAAAQNNHEALTPLYRWFDSDWSFIRGDRRQLNLETARLCAEDSYKQTIESLLLAADLGIIGVETKETDYDDTTRRMFDAMRNVFPDDDGGKLELPQKRTQISFLHRCEHEDSVGLSLANESDGTVAYFGLLGPVVKTLERGGLLCIDELDASLHPLLALQIVRVFNSVELNPNRAQLLFNTHDTNLLDHTVLRRDQIWFTEKDRCGGTHLYPLTDFKVRRGENLKSGYLQGRYGAVPFLGPFGLLSGAKSGA